MTARTATVYHEGYWVAIAIISAVLVIVMPFLVRILLATERRRICATGPTWFTPRAPWFVFAMFVYLGLAVVALGTALASLGKAGDSVDPQWITVAVIILVTLLALCAIALALVAAVSLDEPPPASAN
ncbi:MAG: hypothetical protein JO147_12940 [Actinobacteria bacterium]|nr:hypothetical protein [Actinomycetota bacterium]